MGEKALEINEQENLANKQEATENKGSLQQRLEELISEQGTRSSVSFGFVVLSCVVQGNYDRAFTELNNVGRGLEDYPQFEQESRRFIEHSKSLVSAIKTKRMISLTPQINKAKKRELTEKIMEHFIELKKSIITIEKIEKRVRAEDLSATIAVLKTIYVTAMAIFATYVVVHVYPDIAVIPLAYFKEFFSWMSFELPF